MTRRKVQEILDENKQSDNYKILELTFWAQAKPQPKWQKTTQSQTRGVGKSASKRAKIGTSSKQGKK